MSDVKFRATVKHDGAEVGDLPWLEEFWAVRYGDYSALCRDLDIANVRIEKLEAKLAKAAKLIELAIELGRWELNQSFRDELITFTAELKGELND